MHPTMLFYYERLRHYHGGKSEAILAIEKPGHRFPMGTERQLADGWRLGYGTGFNIGALYHPDHISAM